MYIAINKKWPLSGGTATSDKVLVASNVDISATRSDLFVSKMASDVDYFKFE